MRIDKLPSIRHCIRLCLSFIFNRIRFKKMAFGSLVSNPLRLDGGKYVTISKNVAIQKYSWLFAAKIDAHEPELVIGEGCVIGGFNHIASVRRVSLGKNVLTADNVYISDNLHCYEDINVPIMHQKVIFKAEVHIGDGSWIGENACIIGARIGRNCVVGANAVVTKDVPDYSVVAGAPAVVIKRFNPATKSWEKA